MKVTTGIDIIEVNRIQDTIEKVGESFLKKIYTQKEIDYCNRARGDEYSNIKYQHFAARFAAKEAVFKAIFDYINGREEILWKDIEIVNNEGGKPQINVNNLREKGLKGLQSIDISISHIKEYAVASVVAVFE